MVPALPLSLRALLPRDNLISHRARNVFDGCPPPTMGISHSHPLPYQYPVDQAASVRRKNIFRYPIRRFAVAQPRIVKEQIGVEGRSFTLQRASQRGEPS